MWLWAASDVAADHAAPFALPDLGTGSNVGQVVFRQDMDCTMHASIENALDVPHTAFLHGGLFRRPGRGPRVDAVRTDLPGGVEVHYLGEPAAFGPLRLPGSRASTTGTGSSCRPSPRSSTGSATLVRIVNSILHLPLSADPHAGLVRAPLRLAAAGRAWSGRSCAPAGGRSCARTSRCSATRPPTSAASAASATPRPSSTCSATPSGACCARPSGPTRARSAQRRRRRRQRQRRRADDGCGDHAPALKDLDVAGRRKPPREQEPVSSATQPDLVPTKAMRPISSMDRMANGEHLGQCPTCGGHRWWDNRSRKAAGEMRRRRPRLPVHQLPPRPVGRRPQRRRSERRTDGAGGAGHRLPPGVPAGDVDRHRHHLRGAEEGRRAVSQRCDGGVAVLRSPQRRRRGHVHDDQGTDRRTSAWGRRRQVGLSAAAERGSSFCPQHQSS